MRAGLIPIIPLLLLAGCGSSQLAKSSVQSQETLHIALLDVKQAYSKQNMELKLLREKLEKVNFSEKNAPAAQISLDIERRFNEIEKMLTKAQSDLKDLQNHANQTSNSLAEYNTKISKMENRIREVANLKQTLDSVSKAIGGATSTTKVHDVRSGDSLEKIARKYHTSVAKIKSANSLTSNTIIVGQKLKIPE